MDDEFDVEAIWTRVYTPGSKRAGEITRDEAEWLWQTPTNMRIELMRLVDRQATRGERCGVCGNTAEQSAAIGYDCIHEC